MNITVNKQTAKAIKKALFFTLTACFERESTTLNKEHMQLIGVTENEVIELCKLHTRLNKTEAKKPSAKQKSVK